MCQIASANRGGDLDEFSPSKLPARPPPFLRSRLTMKSSMDIRLCPVMRKYAHLTEDLPENVHLEPPDHAQLADGAEHRCFVCAQFQEKDAEGSAPETNPKEAIASFLKVLRRSTQPIHLAAMAAVITLAIFLDRFRRASLILFEVQSAGRTLWPLVYLSSFSILFGAQMWMTFVSGLVLLFILPRHTFACVQSALFPKYMILNGVSATVALIGFVQMKSSWSLQEDYLQVAGLTINGICPLVARVVVVPSLLQRIQDKVTLERAAGHGPEAGPRLAQITAAILKQCPTYQKICKCFRRLHGTVAAVNVITLACNAFHLYYLASKIAFHH